MNTTPALRLKCAAVALSLLAVSGFSAQAATSTVTNNNDSGPGSLRQAIAGANNGDTINFAPALNGQTITLTTGELVVSQNLTIQGPGANLLSVSGNGTSRVFSIGGGTTVVITGLTVAGGNGIGAFLSGHGGGILNDGTLTINQCAISGNQATTGGGIFHQGNFGNALTITNSTIAGNQGQLFGGGFGSNGPNVTITNSTIAANTASTGVGGGVYNSGGTATIINSTIAGNQAQFYGGGIYSDTFSVLTLKNSIVGNNNATTQYPDVDGIVSSGDYNLIGNTSGILNPIAPNTITGVDPMLGPLQNNGGPTQTMALLSGSPAIDAGSNALAAGILTDQRGYGPRANGVAVDIGAYETNALPTLIVTTDQDVVNQNDGLMSLREALTSAQSQSGLQTIKFNGDPSLGAPVTGTGIVNFYDGAAHTIALNARLDITTNGANVTVQGPGPDKLIVDAGKKSQVFFLTGTPNVALSGMTITNGIVNDFLGQGGGIFVSNATLALTNCALTNNAAISSGGVGSGGALFVRNHGTVTLTACVVSNNLTNGLGGGLLNLGSTLNLVNCAVVSNQAANGGGFCNAGGASTLLGCTFSGNQARAVGGGIFNSQGVTQLLNCTLSGNSASGSTAFGGGFYDAGSTSFVSCTLVGNSANSSAGPAQGGGYSTATGYPVPIKNTIIANNTVSGSSTIGPDANAVFDSQGYNLIGNTSGVSGLSASDLQNVNPMLSSLGNYGGSLQTMVPLPGSPAIDAGDPNFNPSAFNPPLNADERGFSRVVNGAIDIGAVEAAFTTITGPSQAPSYLQLFNVTATVANATSSGTETVQFLIDGASSGSPVLLVNGSASASIGGLSAGPHQITAVYTNGGSSPEGNSTNFSQSVNKVSASISVNGYSVNYNTVGHTATGTATGLNGEDLSALLDLTGTTHTNAQSYTDTWSFSGNSNYFAASGTVSDSIAKINAGIRVNGYTASYDGSAHTATGFANGAGVVALTGLDLSSTTHTSPGTYNDTWTFTDSTGNYNNATGTVNDVIVAPAVVTISGPPTNQTVTNNPTPRFFFTVSNPPATTFCSVAGAPFSQCTSPFTSMFLPDGSYTLSVYARDSFGTQGPTATFGFTVDTHSPVISFPVPLNATLTNRPNPTFTFADTSAPGTPVTFQCSIDGSPNVPCSSPYTVGTLVEGSHTLTVTGTDAAGNVGSASFGFVIDLTPPIITMTSGPPAGSTNPTPTFGFTVSGGAVTTQCSVDTGAFVPCTSPFTTTPQSVGAHTFTVRATDAAGNIGSTNRPFTVSAAVVLVSIQVTPVNPSIPVGRTQQFTATGTFSDGTNQDLTALAAWSSSSASATISNATGSKGVAIGAAPGTSQIRATLGSVSGSTTLTVTAAVLVSIDVTPPNPSVTVNATKQFTATGTFSDGTHQDLTATATWSSSSTSVARITSAGPQIGLATAVAAGTTTITAKSGSVSGSTTLTVTPALPSFAISVSPSTVKQGGVVTVTVNYSNPSSTAQTLTLKFSLTTPNSKTLMLTVPLTLPAAKSGSASFPLPILKSTPVGVYSLTLDAFLGATQVSTSSVQLTVTK